MHSKDRKRKSVADNETFLRLIRVAQEDKGIRKQLIKILSFDKFNRKSSLNTFLENMRLRQEPEDFLAAITSLLDDRVAQKTLEILNNNISDNTGQ